MPNDIDYLKLFGLAEEAGAEETEVTETSAAEGDEGEEETAPAEQSDEDDDTSDDGEGTADEGEAPAAQQRDRKKDAGFAAARRAAEARKNAEIEALKQQHRRELDATVAAMGITDPYTKQLITTKEQYDAYAKRHQEAQREQFMRRAGMTQEQYDAFVAELPEVRQAKDQMAQARSATEAANQQRVKADLEDQVQQIGKIDPAVKSLQDITRAENYQQIYGLVQKGYSLMDAWKIANFDKLTQASAQAARQQARNSAASKAHLGVTGQRGAGAVTVPKEIAAEYRRFDPRITDEEIRKDYARRLKK